MGEMADFVLDQILAEELEEGPEIESEDGYPSRRPPLRFGTERQLSNWRKTCRCCGTTDLVWNQHQGRWRLFTLEGTIHQCPKNPLKELIA